MKDIMVKLQKPLVAVVSSPFCMCLPLKMPVKAVPHLTQALLRLKEAQKGAPRPLK